MKDTRNVKGQKVIDQGQERMLSQKDWCPRYLLCMALESVLRLRSLLLKFCDFILEYFTDKGSLPEMRIWSILLIISELKWCIHFNYLVSVTAGGPVSPRGHM